VKCAGEPDRQLLWGDLHVHTAFSFDAWVYDVQTGPADAYAFARGEALALPLPDGGSLSRSLARPLDFAAVTDHAEFLGEVGVCTTPGSAGYDTDACASYREQSAYSIQMFGVVLASESPEHDTDICGDDGADCLEMEATAWAEIQSAANAANAPCDFTALIAYEWSGATAVTNLHRNVIFASETVPERPVDYVDQPTPEGFLAAIDAACTGDCEVLSIPHNSNLSNGQMFPPAETAEAAETRARLEPLMEVYQHKGASDCMPGLGPLLAGADDRCDFERFERDQAEDCGEETGTGGMISSGCTSWRDYLHGVLVAGLQDEARLGVNPYRLGVIASTDTHSGAPGMVAEKDWPGHLGNAEVEPAQRLADTSLANPGGVLDSPGGLVAVWAEENTRASVFAALQRREVYGTSGPRITVRFFGGADIAEDICDAADLVSTADAAGVPMGGTLPNAGNTPRFVVSALADPGTDAGPGRDLDRIQIVKGWIDDDGTGHTEVFDVVDSGGTGSVDPATCQPTGSGAASLCGTWTDPDWSAGQRAVYTARVLELPTCRWSAWDCLSLTGEDRPESCDDEDVPSLITERAWTSPIWGSG